MKFEIVENDVNGNPRYVVHFLELITDQESENFYKKPLLTRGSLYDVALAKAKKIGGRKYRNKRYGGGIVFQSYNVGKLERDIIEARG